MALLKRILLSSLISTLPLASWAAYWSPHVGADIVGWGIEPAEILNYEFITDKNPFPRINRAGDIYIGTRINGFFGIDVGYEQAQRKEGSVVFAGGELVFAERERPNNAATVKMDLKAYFVHLNFYWEVVKRLELMFMMGVAYLHPDATVYHFSYENEGWQQYRNESEVKYSGRFGFALQYSPVPCIGIKGMVNWDQTRRIEFLGFDQHNQIYDVLPYHKSTTYSLGLVYSFSNPRRHPHRIGLHKEDIKY